MAGLGYHLRGAASCLRQSPFGALVAATTIGVALALAGVVLTAGDAAEGAIRALVAEARITVFVKPGTAEDGLADAAKAAAGGGAEAVFVPPDVALVRLKADLGAAGRALDGLAANPLPASVEVRLARSEVDAKGLDAVRAAAVRLKALSFAADVDYGEAFVEKLENVLLAVRAGAAIVFAAALAVALFLVGSVVRLAVYARRDEIDILRLVGATDGFIAIPFVLEGAFQGLAGGVLAAIAVTAFGRAALPAMLQVLGFAQEIVVRPLAVWELALLVAGGVVMGLVASAVAVLRFLRRAA